MKIIKKILYTALLFSSPLLFAQQGKLAEANKKYEKHAYINAAEIYREVAESGFESEELLEKLANSYYFNARYAEAAQYYSRLFELNPDKEAILTLRYAQSLKSIGEAQDAERYFRMYYRETSADKNTANSSEIDFQALLEDNSGRYSIEELKINSPGIDYGAAINTEGQLIFASTRDTGVVRRTHSAWDGLSFLDLYVAADPSSAAAYRKLKGQINTTMHESGAVITKDGSTMYFTRSRGVIGKGRDSISTLGIYRSHFINGKWDDIEDLSINSPEFSNAHPALSSDENFLFFSSDKPGGFGQSDVYKVEIFEDGSLGEPVNLGALINTLGRETFPFVSSDDLLYFSSDGHFGLGGLDIFYWNPKDNLTRYPINLGAPLNSPTDDFAFSLDPYTGSGYFSSNRPGGKGYDDIYRFLEQENLKQVHQVIISGKVIDKESGKPLANSDISVIDQNNKKLETISTDREGKYKIAAERFSPFFIRAGNDDYFTDEKDGDAEKQVQKINFELEQNIFKVYKGENLAKALGIEVIYFDLDKAEIRPDAAVELEKVLAVMQKYPKVKIEIRSHTDSRASEVYNLKLSERRAKATMEYLLKMGIAAERLSSKGFGETQPVNECADGKPCSEEQHQQNRRSEFILIDF